MIQATGIYTPRAASAGPAPAPRQLEVKPEVEGLADRYNASRQCGNYTSGIVLGAAKETVASAVQSPLLLGSMVKNLYKAETIGPNLKILGTLASPIGTAFSLVAAPFAGGAEAVKVIWTAQNAINNDASPLRQDSSRDYAKGILQPGEQSKEPKTMTGRWMKHLDEFGNAKLQPGEKPHDVPILSPLFALTGGAVSGAISGVVGLVAGLVAGTITTGKEMGRAFTAKDETLGQRVGQFIAAPLNMIVMGPALAWNGIKESVPRGLVDGWRHGPIKPVVDTVKVSAGLATAAIKEAWER